MNNFVIILVPSENIDLMDLCYAVREEEGRVVLGAYEEGECLSTLNEEYLDDILPGELGDFIKDATSWMDHVDEIYVEKNLAYLFDEDYSGDEDEDEDEDYDEMEGIPDDYDFDSEENKDFIREYFDGVEDIEVFSDEYIDYDDDDNDEYEYTDDHYIIDEN